MNIGPRMDRVSYIEPGSHHTETWERIINKKRFMFKRTFTYGDASVYICAYRIMGGHAYVQHVVRFDIP